MKNVSLTVTSVALPCSVLAVPSHHPLLVCCVTVPNPLSVPEVAHGQAWAEWDPCPVMEDPT